MPILGTLLLNLFTGLAGGIASWFVQRTATRVAVSAALVFTAGALMVLFNAIVSPLVATMFATQYGQFLGLAFPPIAGTCLASITATWVGCATYKLRERAILVNN